MNETRRRRRESPQVRRAQILEAATQSFRDCGLQGTTVDRIASEAGVSVGLLYRFFASKSAIIEAIVAEDIEMQFAQAIALLERAARRPERLPQLISEQLTHAPVDRERFALQFEISAETCRNEQLREFIRNKRAELMDALEERFTEWGSDRSSARQMLEGLSLAGAVASGMAMHAAIYSDPPRIRDDLIPPLMKIIFEQHEPRAERG